MGDAHVAGQSTAVLPLVYLLGQALPLELGNSMHMMKLWLRLVPPLSRLGPLDRIKVLDQAGKASFSSAESVIMVIWLILVYLLTKGIVAGTPK